MEIVVAFGLMALVITFLIVVIVSGFSKPEQKQKLNEAGQQLKETGKHLVPIFAVLFVAALMLLPMAGAFAQTPEPTLNLEIDPAPLFASIQAYVPLFFGILAVAGGILIGKRIAEFVIKAIADAF